MKRFVQLLPLLMLLCYEGKAQWHMQPSPLQTRWAKDVNPDKVLPEYPRPQMVRNEWQNLNGPWQYAITDKDAGQPAQFDGQILVPFAIESALSGVKKPVLPTQRLWYKRTFTKPHTQKRVLLHFGAVDWQTTVLINGKEAGQHTGGYQNFSFDITDLLKNGDNELVVSVYDPTDKGPNPHGKQVLVPQGIRYTASTGIWQTVWLEMVSPVYITSLEMVPDVDGGYLSLKVNTNTDGYTVEASAAGAGSVKGAANTTLKLPVQNAHLWSPEDPFLYYFTVKLVKNGTIEDQVTSYFGMRKIEIKKDDKGQERIFLNNKYTYNLGVLDQGFWPDGIYTAPTDAALKFDIEAIKSMGFNTIRKHIKIEPARWYYYADKLGMMVWQDMVTGASLEPDAKKAFEEENAANVTQLFNYPSIICWVLFNEEWYTYDQARITKWLKQRDPSRLVNGHTGENYDRDNPQNSDEKWPDSDMADIHDYPGPGQAPVIPGKARVLGEWGGVGVPVTNHQWNAAAGWGYVRITPSEMSSKYTSMMKRLKTYETEGLSGSIYTEPYDVEIEENGLMTYDREIIKIPLATLRKIHAAFAAQKRSENLIASLKLKDADTTSSPDPNRKQFLEILEQEADAKKTHDWKTMSDNLTDYLKKGGTRFTGLKLSSMAKKVFDNTNDSILLNQALAWMQQVVTVEKNSVTMSTYANILYKLGRNKEALDWMYKALNISPASDEEMYQGMMDKMKKGEKTWQ